MTYSKVAHRHFVDSQKISIFAAKDAKSAKKTQRSKSCVIARHEALIFLGEKLNVPCTAQRVNYMEVIHNLLTTYTTSRDCFVPRNDEKNKMLFFASFAAKNVFVCKSVHGRRQSIGRRNFECDQVSDNP